MTISLGRDSFSKLSHALPYARPKNHSENSALAFIEKRKKHEGVQSIIML